MTICWLCVVSQQKNYTATWDKIKATSYQIPHDSHALQHAKNQKIVLSNVSSILSSVKFISWCSVLGFLLHMSLNVWPVRDNMNHLAPVGEIQGGLREVQISLQSAQVSRGWSCQCSLRQSWKAGARRKLNLFCYFMFHVYIFLNDKYRRWIVRLDWFIKQLKCIQLCISFVQIHNIRTERTFLFIFIASIQRELREDQGQEPYPTRHAGDPVCPQHPVHSQWNQLPQVSASVDLPAGHADVRPSTQSQRAAQWRE